MNKQTIRYKPKLKETSFVKFRFFKTCALSLCFLLTFRHLPRSTQPGYPSVGRWQWVPAKVALAPYPWSHGTCKLVSSWGL